MHATLLRILLLIGALVSSAAAETVAARMTSQFLVRGEQAALEYILPDGIDPRATLESPQVENLSIKPVGYGAELRRGFGRNREYVFTFIVSGYEPGTYTIPSVQLDTGGGTIATEPVSVRIMHEAELDFRTIEVGGTSFRYCAAFFVTKDNPFVNEVIPTELKLYIPSDQRIEDWGIPEFERNGVAAWRFEPRPSLGRANLPGGAYYAVSYPSTLSPTRAGSVTLGPAKLRLITIQTSLGSFGTNAFYEPANLDIPELTLEARPLPKEAPEGFTDAVGNFTLTVNAAETEVREGDPISLNLIISGSGNLDTLDPPSPIDEDGWKLYPPSSLQRDEARRELTGITAFRQFIRPLRTQNQVPPFRFVFFNPATETFQTLISDPIPLRIFPATNAAVAGAAVPPALPMPIEEMTDILGIIDRGGPLVPIGKPIPWHWWQIIPALVAVILILRILALHLAPRLKADPVVSARKRDFQNLTRSADAQVDFYRAAGAYIEKWLGQSQDPIVRELLGKRDETCFRQDVDRSTLPRSERQRILRELRRLTLPLITLAALLIGAPRSHAAPDVSPADPVAAFEEARYSEAAALWLSSGPWDQLPADTLYNIGNAAYRLGSPGEAALYWRRALHRDPTHAESRQNLRFFERKFGALTIKRPDYQYTLATLPLATWKQLAWGGLWLAGLSLLVFPATRFGSRLRIAAIAALVTAPLLSGAGFAAWRWYPDDARFAPPTEQAVVIADRADVRTDAARNAPLVIQAPAGSLCHILTRSGDWTYIAFANATRGWVPNESIAPVVVPETPTPPKAPEKPSDEQNA